MYCVVTDLLRPAGYFTENELAQLVSNSGETIELREDRVESIIEERTDYINAFLRVRYEVPITGAPMILSVCRDLVSYDLKSRANGKATPEFFINIEAKAIKLLNKIQTGEIVIKEIDNTVPINTVYKVPAQEFDLSGY
jgi:phage gp36-like protein